MNATTANEGHTIEKTLRILRKVLRGMRSTDHRPRQSLRIRTQGSASRPSPSVHISTQQDHGPGVLDLFLSDVTYRTSPGERKAFVALLVRLHGSAYYEQEVIHMERMRSQYPEFSSIAVEDLIALRGSSGSDWQYLHDALESADPKALHRFAPYFKAIRSACNALSSIGYLASDEDVEGNAAASNGSSTWSRSC